MISVQTLWLIIRDLSRKDNIGGYLQTAEFNRQVNLCQDILFDYYIDNEKEREARGALINFESASSITRSGDTYPLPDDYKEKIEAALEVGGSYYPVHFPARDELLMSLSSAIRGPSIERKSIVGKIRASDIQIWPQSTNKLFLQYYRTPVTASRAVTVDVGNVEEVYVPGSTVNLEWPADLLQDFVDLMLLFKGVVIRDSSLIQWVKARKVIEKELVND